MDQIASKKPTKSISKEKQTSSVSKKPGKTPRAKLKNNCKGGLVQPLLKADVVAYFCIYCKRKCDDNNLEEDWLMCGQCKKWCHESCAPIERGQKAFVCDFCYK